MPEPSISKLSVSNALPLTKVVQNDAYTTPVLLSSLGTKALTSISWTLLNKEDSPKELLPAEPVVSTLEGTKMTVTNLHLRVTEEDTVEVSVYVEP
ncbi:hypothetical protein QTO34_000133 [Cnephaeus nilssonii]|uniref:Uncharacterized protein n=1 Tax=Cnephaeus nilssonii TaxID=3371016 RepID=A0AA40IAV6_CNENI|nr:hypothetical protein QTO34_000133 [Eptesicus nilssonii]